MSAGYLFPDFVCTSIAPPSSCLKEATASPSARWTPFFSRWRSTRRAHSGSSGAMTWSSISTSVTSRPRWTRFSAISRPMYPPPTTTARFGLCSDWSPVDWYSSARSLAPRSSHSRICRASGTVRTEKIPGRSIPGSGGRIGAAPGESTSLS